MRVKSVLRLLEASPRHRTQWEARNFDSRGRARSADPEVIFSKCKFVEHGKIQSIIH